MTGRLPLLAKETFRALLARRTNIALAVLLFGLLTVASCSLQVSGQTMVNGEVVPIGSQERLGLAVGTTFGGLHFFGALLVLFLLVPAVTGEIDTGLAAWVLVKPIPRSTYLMGRVLGAFLFLAVFAALTVIGLEVLLVRYAGGPRLSALTGGGVLVLLLGAYLVWGVLFTFHLGAGPGGIAIVILALSGTVVDFDPLTRVFLRSGGEPEGAGFLDTLFMAMQHGEGPPAAARAVYAVLYALLPGTGNLHDLAVAVATERSLSIATDLISLGVVVAGLPVALFAARRALERREL